MRIEDLKLPANHVVVSLGDWLRRGDGGGRIYAGAFMAVVGEEGALAPEAVVLNPECFRVVPRTLLEEHRAMLERHEQDHTAFAERVRVMPEIRVDVSIR